MNAGPVDAIGNAVHTMQIVDEWEAREKAE